MSPASVECWLVEPPLQRKAGSTSWEAETWTPGNASLSAVEVRPSPLRGVRMVVDVIFSYTNRGTDFTEKFCVRVDATEEFPFLVSKLAPYYDRYT